MPGNAIGLSLNFGFAGYVSRIGKDPIIESRPVNSDSDDIPFGKAVYQNTDDTYQLADADATPTNFAGVAYAGAKQGVAYAPGGGEINQNGAYVPDTPCAVIKEGIVCVKIADSGTPDSGGAVYVRMALNGTYPDEVLGDFRTADDGGNAFLVPNAVWHSNRKDANGIAELKLKYPNI